MNIRIITHRNGGLEQGLLEIAKEEGLLSKEDKEKLNQLRILPQNRTEVIVNGKLKSTQRSEKWK